MFFQKMHNNQMQTIFFLNRYDLFLVILVSHTKQIIANENFNFEMFCKIGVLKNFVKITGKYLCWRSFLNKVSCLLPHRYFPANFAKFLRTFFLLKISGGYFIQNTHNSKMDQKQPKIKNQKLNRTLIIPNIRGRKNVNVTGKDLLS